MIGAVNALGAALLGDDFRPLRVGAPPQRPSPPGEGPAVELLLTGREGWDEEEIELRAGDRRRAPRRTSSPRRASSPSACASWPTQGVDRGEMVVLLRAFTQLDAYEDSLERAGLRPYVVGGRGYWSQQQVADVCALLATIANPLDDQALFGALASPACGARPRHALAAARRCGPAAPHLADARARRPGCGEDERDRPRARSRQIPEPELSLLRGFAETLAEPARAAPPRSRSPGLIDAAVTETGYDLAVLMRPSGEARFANVRKLMRLAADFEAAEGRDLRGLLDFLAARADADADAQAATAVEGHDGVRIMTIHSAKGLEFDVVAIPHLSRGLLPGSGRRC